MPASRTLEESFHRIAIKGGPDECWSWAGHRNHKGYGAIRRRVDGRSRCFKASHVAWSIANGRPFPAGKIALHSCDNPACVNPAHISPGTHLENMADKIAKGRADISGLRNRPVNSNL